MTAKHLFWAAALLSASVGFMKSERASDQASVAIHVMCDQGAGEENGSRGPLQRAIDTSQPGASILVSGTCLENLMIPIGKDGITLDGGGTAAITPADQTLPAVLVRARDVTVRGFTITGGFGGEKPNSFCVLLCLFCGEWF